GFGVATGRILLRLARHPLSCFLYWYGDQRALHSFPTRRSSDLQEILARVVRQAAERRGDGVVLTFFPHPTSVLAPERAPASLTPLCERLDRMRDAGVSTVVLQHFTRAFAALEASDFVERYLVRCLGVVKVIIGHSVNFGRGRGGNAATLEDAGRRFGFEVEVVG